MLEELARAQIVQWVRAAEATSIRSRIVQLVRAQIVQLVKQLRSRSTVSSRCFERMQSCSSDLSIRTSGASKSELSSIRGWRNTFGTLITIIIIIIIIIMNIQSIIVIIGICIIIIIIIIIITVTITITITITIAITVTVTVTVLLLLLLLEVVAPGKPATDPNLRAEANAHGLIAFDTSTAFREPLGIHYRGVQWGGGAVDGGAVETGCSDLYGVIY